MYGKYLFFLLVSRFAVSLILSDCSESWLNRHPFLMKKLIYLVDKM